MCGIYAFIELLKNSSDRRKMFADFMSIKHRGPDMSSFQTIKNVSVGFHRLAIMDPTFHANQPYILEDGERTIIFVCNGEIYNFKELIAEYNLPIHNNSDCMTIPQLYIKLVNEKNDMTQFTELFSRKIKGEFAFVLFEFDKFQDLKNIVAGRDQIGVRPMYYHCPTEKSNGIIFCSEIKGMLTFKDRVQEFEPGNIINMQFDSLGKLSNVFKHDFKTVYNIIPPSSKHVLYTNEIEQLLLKRVRDAFINSVKRRLTADRPIAFLLSGGVDSSLVVGIANQILKQPLRTFCCGMANGTDLRYARMVADHIKSNHTEVYFTEKEGLDSLEDVNYTIESWDTTTNRASVGQYAVCKHIGTKTDIKVVLVGEGPDEVCSSYLFNYYAPNGEELHLAAKDYVANIHQTDGRRADRCISRWGLEGRIPGLDPEFIEAYWSIPSEWRHPKYKGIEKWWLRKAFDGFNIIPDEVLWRKKEAFSDGVSGKERSWFQMIQEHVQSKVSVKDSDTPTIEAQYFKNLFIETFGRYRLDVLSGYWQPRWINKDGSYVDPSARTLTVYEE